MFQMRDLTQRLDTLINLLDHIRISNQLSGIKEVSEEEFAEVESQILAAEEARTKTQERIDSLVALELRARRWADTQSKLAGVRQKLTDAEKLL